ncbi:MAG: glycoside hydrolase family 38 C-terminal domain-containing protein, partial [Ruthenibacterium sp.]
RTIANQLSLMEQFPEYRFLQSASCHTQMIEQQYPTIFEAMKEKIAQGRYEPNGAVWVECDCNLTGGEAMVRQFLWGQRYTQQKFGITSDCFWLPDTFGYSAAIPQIMKGFGVSYFLTTKLAWNDTNTFPYESFVWEGIDKTKVLVHFFVMDTWTDPNELSERLYGNSYADCLHNKQLGSDRLVAFGYGDGGGGPQFEMIELARRLHDVEGCPKTEYTSASDFMKKLSQKEKSLPVYKGELYLELHRGTLTGKQQIKKNNRMAEIGLHHVEFLTVLRAFFDKTNPCDKAYRSLWEVLLQNQFHDILPGSCIPQAHDEAIDAVSQVIAATDALQQTLAQSFAQNTADAGAYSLCNTTSFKRNDVVYLTEKQPMYDKNGTLRTQQIVTRDGETLLAVAGVVQEPYAFTPLILENGADAHDTLFVRTENTLQTPFFVVQFTQDGFLASLVERRTGREMCAGLPLNTFVAAEDVPAAWDGWDIDADCFAKLAPCAQLLNSQIVSSGAVEYRIRNTYAICQYSKIEQDIIFYADSALITFDTRLTWNEKHQLLKTAFDTTVQNTYATCETQFGSIKRPTTRNDSVEQAMFEVCNHKYTDLSEPGSGVTLLNDCKYGISVEGGKMMLSLAKGGLRPDDRGDAGVYTFRYALLLHEGGYSAKNVTLPAYCFNDS